MILFIDTTTSELRLLIFNEKSVKSAILLAKSEKGKSSNLNSETEIKLLQKLVNFANSSPLQTLIFLNLPSISLIIHAFTPDFSKDRRPVSNKIFLAP